MNSQKLRLADIEIGERFRDVDDGVAEIIAASFREIGQRTPIEVRKKDGAGKYKLIAGAHRMRAAESAEWVEIEGFVKDVTNHEAELIEIDENLARADLTVLDRAVSMARRKTIYEALHPETKHGGDRTSEQVAEFYDLVPERFTKDTAARLGMSERAVQACVRRAKISKEARKKLTGTIFANKGLELDALLELGPTDKPETAEAQLRAIDAVLAGGEGAPTTLRKAVAQQLGKQDDAANKDEKLFDAFKKLWSRAPAKVKRRMADYAKAEIKKIRADLGQDDAQ